MVGPSKSGKGSVTLSTYQGTTFPPDLVEF